jgi:hypothetical protein
MTEESTFTLTFHVPEIDFDAGDLDVALDWIVEQLKHIDYPLDRAGGFAAYRVLNTIHSQYMDALGEPNWKRPSLEAIRKEQEGTRDNPTTDRS